MRKRPSENGHIKPVGPASPARRRLVRLLLAVSVVGLATLRVRLMLDMDRRSN